MKNYFVAIIIIVLFNTACNNPTEKKIDMIQRTNIYDSIEKQRLKELDNLDLRGYFDTTKWLLYTLHCDDTAVNNAGKLFPLSSAEMKLSLVERLNDTLSLLYFFMENDSKVINKQLKSGSYIKDGVQFKLSKNEVIAYISGETTLTKFKPGSRFENTLQPDVIAYIKANRDKLNTWFRNEAIKRKVLD